PGLPSAVVRSSESPRTLTVVVARTTVVPVWSDVIVAVHDPLVPSVVHVLTPFTNDPEPLTIANVIGVPAGASTNPLPGFTFTCAVSTCVVPTGFRAVGGVIWMLASTYVLTPSAELPF